MKTFEEIETAVVKATELLTAARFNEARTLAIATHADAFALAKSFERDSIEEGRARLFLTSCNEILRLCNANK